MNYQYFINNLIIIISALCSICISSGLIFKTNIDTVYIYELNTAIANFVYFIGALTGIVFSCHVLKSKNFKIPAILYINIDINLCLYANGFFFYFMLINVLINMFPLALIPDMCYYYYGSYYKAKEFYYIMFFLCFFAGFTQSAAVSFIILERFKIMTNKALVIPLLIICILSFLVGTLL